MWWWCLYCCPLVLLFPFRGDETVGLARRIALRILVFDDVARNASGDVDFVGDFVADAIGVVGYVPCGVAFNSGGEGGDEVAFKGRLTTD